MDLRALWPHFDSLCQLAERCVDLEVWAFGSALRRHDPHDLDVLLVYDDRASVIAVRDARRWSEMSPPCHIIAMTRTEEREYKFIYSTGAIRFV
jgi:predicted nucleotidyltransferase